VERDGDGVPGAGKRTGVEPLFTPRRDTGHPWAGPSLGRAVPGALDVRLDVAAGAAVATMTNAHASIVLRGNLSLAPRLSIGGGLDDFTTQDLRGWVCQGDYAPLEQPLYRSVFLVLRLSVVPGNGPPGDGDAEATL